MHSSIKVVVITLSFLVLSACAGLANMKEVEFKREVPPDRAMVNIVRRSVFAGDGANIEMWDGEESIGTLAAGRLLQYETTPGEHTFMVYMQGSWGVAKGELKGGKTYYLKYNMGFGFVTLGVAKSDDPRIGEWNKMKTVSIDSSQPKKVPERFTLGARKILERIENGKANVTPITDNNAL